MKRVLAVAAAALFATTLGTGVADASPRDITPTIAFPGEHVRYFFSSDTPRNDIAYYAAGGKLVVARNVTFQPTLINIGSGPRYHTHRAFTSPGRQLIGSTMQTYGWSAQCQVQLDGRTVDSAYVPGRRNANANC
ncbi:hypothetical protein BH769_gp37 [Gordonia phage BritBrat]|uniref:Uncharacterized protein n=1 Tax=Gordonia phage BritBrat TaxID=1838064 RepID=A0A161HSQ2_9CAUD|nr:hypothetical protein BH769_gp37 [Gordonia phage BritBrat]ANA85245.1 hypothetical protein PBI_BRITBRAT_37 [Gordonia phage BritBrat]